MPADYSALNAAVQANVDQATATEGTEASAIVVLQGFAAQIIKAVSDALAADNAADQGSIDAAVAAVNTVTARYTASGAALGAAIAALPGTATQHKR